MVRVARDAWSDVVASPTRIHLWNCRRLWPHCNDEDAAAKESAPRVYARYAQPPESRGVSRGRAFISAEM